MPDRQKTIYAAFVLAFGYAKYQLAGDLLNLYEEDGGDDKGVGRRLLSKTREIPV